MRLGALSVVVLLALPRVGRAYCRTTIPHAPPGACEAGTPVSWGVACLGLYINTRGLRASPDAGQDLDGLLRRYVASSADAWSEASCGGSARPALRMVVAGDADVPLDLARDGRNVVSVNRQWSPDAYHRPGTIAFTVVTSDVPSGTLLEADVELNARAMENPLGREFADGPPVWGVVDAPTVILHEIGHVAGLWHSLEPGAVMEASMDVERQRRTLTGDDQRGICAVYPLSNGVDRPSADCVPERPVPGVARQSQGPGCSAAQGLSPERSCVLPSLFVGLCVIFRRRPRSHRPSP